MYSLTELIYIAKRVMSGPTFKNISKKKQEGEQTGTTQEMSTSSSDPQKRPPFMASGSPTVNNPREESRNG